MYGGSSGINSYVGHEFEVHEIPSKTRGCRNKECRKTGFVVSGDEDQGNGNRTWVQRGRAELYPIPDHRLFAFPSFTVFTIQKDFTVLVENHRTKALKIAQEAIDQCSIDTTLPPLERIDAYSACLVRQVNATLEAKKEEIHFEKSVRHRMGERMARYACGGGDTSQALNTTEALRNITWTYRDEKSAEPEAVTAGTAPAAAAAAAAAGAKRIRTVPHRAQVLFESDHNALVLVENFMTEEQCRELVAAASSASTPVGEEGTEPQQRREMPLSAQPRVIGPLLAKIQQLVLSYAPSANLDLLENGQRRGSDPSALSLQILKPPLAASSISEGESACTAATADAGGASAREGECGSSSTALSSSSGDIVYRAAAVTGAEDGGGSSAVAAVARLRIVCDASPDLVGGGVHYPRVGVHVNPRNHPSGHAVLAVYQDPATGRREPDDPYLEEAVECGVRRGRLVVVAQDFFAAARSG